MKKLCFPILSLFLYLTIGIIAHVHAENEFDTSVNIEYRVSEAGQTSVSQATTLTNLFSTIHAVSYSLTIEGTTPTNIRAFEENKELPINISTEGNIATINVSFPEAVVGKGNSRTFTLSYQDPKIAIKNGQVWEITIPKIQNVNQYKELSLRLIVPKSFNPPAYITPKPGKTIQTESEVLFLYTASELTEQGVVAAFGKFQVFNFELFYHLKNPLRSYGITEIALPPDTAFQRVYYETIEPRPISIRVDEDSNWLASYRLRPSEQMDIKVRGSVQLFATPQEFYPKQEINPQDYLEYSEYWQTTDPQILALASELKTPRVIYDYVVNTLQYDYSRVKEGIERLGATRALENPTSAICMEFTDLFITLSRAAGIPAREVNGFAYTENPQIQPLSLVADVLHAWPEYWDSERGVWTPVDPTWGNTTGGVDYFSKFDLSHITFAIHGISPTEPLPAGSYKLAQNPQKDVTVFFGTLPEKKETVNLSIKLNRQLVPFLPFAGIILIENQGLNALYNPDPVITATTGKISIKEPKTSYVLPFTNQTIDFSWRPSSLLEYQGEINVVVAGTKTSYTVGTEILISRILGIFTILTILTALALAPILIIKRVVKKDEASKFSILTRKTWRLPFQRPKR